MCTRTHTHAHTCTHVRAHTSTTMKQPFTSLHTSQEASTFHLTSGGREMWKADPTAFTHKAVQHTELTVLFPQYHKRPESTPASEAVIPASLSS